MDEIVKKAQAEADRLQTPIYVFRAFGANGDELGWFNASGVKHSPKDELYEVIHPQTNNTDV
jgi:hypothetical protein